MIGPGSAGGRAGAAARALGAVLAVLSGAWQFGCAVSPADRLVRAGGFDRWRQVEAITFTFHVQKGEQELARAWRWLPREDRVLYRGQGPDGQPVELAYERKGVSAGPPTLATVDAWFVNDSFWLLMPLHLTWSPEVAVEDAGPAPLPLGPGSARRLWVRYPPDGGGYTPGDAYELFVDEDWRIVQWVYHRGGAAEPTLTSRWESYERHGPLWLSMRRQSGDGRFRLWFTDVAVRRSP